MADPNNQEQFGNREDIQERLREKGEEFLGSSKSENEGDSNQADEHGTGVSDSDEDSEYI